MQATRQLSFLNEESPPDGGLVPLQHVLHYQKQEERAVNVGERIGPRNVVGPDAFIELVEKLPKFVHFQTPSNSVAQGFY